ncbi:hypothetical protein KY330_00670 [Candidatus Woesearchaeota archaeon]|nr:hypothetical protein [Candidatus Woesearchaeota archaeon]
MIDLVFPKNNEQEFIKLAEKLNFSALCFCYTFKNHKKPFEFQKKTNIKLYSAIIAKPNEIKKSRKADLVISKSSEDNRRVLENQKPDLIFSLEDSKDNDFIFYRNSGLNQVLCKIAASNNIIVGFSFNLILNSLKRAQVIGRIMQNIKLCKKYKVTTAFASFATNPMEMRSSHDLIAFAEILGHHPKHAKESIQTLEKRIKLNLKKKSPNYIAEGIKLIE